jgi:hypothetical protein
MLRKHPYRIQIGAQSTNEALESAMLWTKSISAIGDQWRNTVMASRNQDRRVHEARLRVSRCTTLGLCRMKGREIHVEIGMRPNGISSVQGYKRRPPESPVPGKGAGPV